MTDYATTIGNLATALDCANDGATVAATLTTRANRYESQATRPTNLGPDNDASAAMRLMADKITRRENIAGIDADLSSRSAGLIANFASLLAP